MLFLAYFLAETMFRKVCPTGTRGESCGSRWQQCISKHPSSILGADVHYRFFELAQTHWQYLEAFFKRQVY
jgi:hypothetical protein